MRRGLTRLPALVTIPAAGVYQLVVEARNRRFDRGRGIRRVNVPVISVGNITVGGAGKSPFVRHLAHLLLDSGHSPAIAMRGYAARHGRRSDEELEHLEAMPRVKVVVGGDRAAALGEFLPLHPEVDCVVLDDGFQHRQLHRDLDLVLVSARHRLDDRPLPAGRLREPAANLQRASAVIVTHAGSVLASLKEEIRRRHGDAPLAWTRHVWRELRVMGSPGSEVRVEPSWLRGRRVVPLLAVGDPEAILQQLRDEGASVEEGVIRQDHAGFSRRDLARARRRGEGADAVLMTAKDWVRTRELIDFSRFRVPIVVPQLEIEVFHGSSALRDRVLGVVGGAGERGERASEGQAGE